MIMIMLIISYFSMGSLHDEIWDQYDDLDQDHYDDEEDDDGDDYDHVDPVLLFHAFNALHRHEELTVAEAVYNG